MGATPVHTLDLNFQGRAHAIAAYLIKHSSGAVLVESGPGSTLEGLERGLAAHGLTVGDVTHVLLTHIHLDHAGAAGWLAQQGATIYVHPVGAPHMLNPEKLIASATRIYGEMMDKLWGQFLPVPESNMIIPQDGEEIAIGNLRFVALNTPGHAEHHYAYLFEDLCFTGDVGGVRIPGYQYLRVPMPPPELHFPKWRESVKLLRKVNPKRLAPTHFGIYDDPEWQFSEIEKDLDNTERWLEQIMPADPQIDELRAKLTAWMEDEAVRLKLSDDVVQAYSLANPVGMSADGLQRYWRKHRMAA